MAGRGFMYYDIYYSSILPKGSKEAKNMKWNLQDSDLFRIMESDSATAKDTERAQIRLAELGYLEPDLVDTHRGEITDGAVRRWRYNTDDSGERYWQDVMKNEDLISKAVTGVRNWWKGE